MRYVVTASAVSMVKKGCQCRKDAAKAAITINPFEDSGVGGLQSGAEVNLRVVFCRPCTTLQYGLKD
jgi:hypothetical protein